MSADCRVVGVGRDVENPKVLVVYFSGEPTDDQLREVHERLSRLGFSQRLREAGYLRRPSFRSLPSDE